MRVRRDKRTGCSPSGVRALPRRGRPHPHPRRGPRRAPRPARRTPPPATTVGVTGRVIFLRNTGKLCFATLREGDGTELQAMLCLAGSARSALARWKATSTSATTSFVTGEVITSQARRAVGAGRPLGDGGEGAAPAAGRAHEPLSEEARVRQRYVDLIVRPQAREMVRDRAAVVRTLRDVLHGRGFIEVETPMLQFAARRRRGPAVRHARQRARPRPVPADRAGAVPQALRGRRHRPGLRDQPQLPQRGYRLLALAGVRDAGGLPGLRRLRRRWPS